MFDDDRVLEDERVLSAEGRCDGGQHLEGALHHPPGFLVVNKW